MDNYSFPFLQISKHGINVLLSAIKNLLCVGH